MVEIKKSFFRKLDREIEHTITLPIIESEKACQQVAFIYSQYVHKQSGRHAYLLTPRMNKKDREKRLAQIRKLIHIAADLGVSEEIYIKAQFEQQMIWLSKSGLNYVPFINLISQKAAKWFTDYKERIDKSYDLDARKKEFYSTEMVNIRQAIQDSISKFYDRLKRVKFILEEITIDTALMEMEIMVRAGMISNIYLMVSPLVACEGSEFLSIMRDKAEKILSSFDKTAAVKIRKELMEKFDDKEILEYV